MDNNNSFEIEIPLSNHDNTNNNKSKPPFKRVRAVGKSAAYLTTSNNKRRIKIREPVKGGVRFTSKYINTVDKYLNKKFNKLGKPMGFNLKKRLNT